MLRRLQSRQLWAAAKVLCVPRAAKHNLAQGHCLCCCSLCCEHLLRCAERLLDISAEVAGGFQAVSGTFSFTYSATEMAISTSEVVDEFET